MTRSPKRRTPKPGPLAKRGALERSGARLVPAARLRQLFDHAGVLDRHTGGELTERVLRSGTPSPDSNEPTGTESLYVGYYDHTGTLIAEAHYYRRPDGSIGASRKIDPKLVVPEGKTYLLDTP